MIYNRRGNRERRNPEVSFQEAMPEYHGQSQRYLFQRFKLQRKYVTDTVGTGSRILLCSPFSWCCSVILRGVEFMPVVNCRSKAVMNGSEWNKVHLYLREPHILGRSFRHWIIRQAQYCDGTKLLEGVSTCRSRLHYRHFRPRAPVSGDTPAWWLDGCQAGLQNSGVWWLSWLAVPA